MQYLSAIVECNTWDHCKTTNAMLELNIAKETNSHAPHRRLVQLAIVQIIKEVFGQHWIQIQLYSVHMYTIPWHHHSWIFNPAFWSQCRLEGHRGEGDPPRPTQTPTGVDDKLPKKSYSVARKNYTQSQEKIILINKKKLYSAARKNFSEQRKKSEQSAAQKYVTRCTILCADIYLQGSLITPTGVSLFYEFHNLFNLFRTIHLKFGFRSWLVGWLSLIGGGRIFLQTATLALRPFSCSVGPENFPPQLKAFYSGRTFRWKNPGRSTWLGWNWIIWAELRGRGSSRSSCPAMVILRSAQPSCSAISPLWNKEC